jgi:hypothetical protein
MPPELDMIRDRGLLSAPLLVFIIAVIQVNKAKLLGVGAEHMVN